MKISTSGRWLWTRISGSTLCGELVDSGLLYSIAFAGLWPTEQPLAVTTRQYLVIATPLTYRVVAFLKRAEGEDYYDRNTDFTPFYLKARAFAALKKRRRKRSASRSRRLASRRLTCRSAC